MLLPLPNFRTPLIMAIALQRKKGIPSPCRFIV